MQVVKDMKRRVQTVKAVVEEVTKKDVIQHRAIGSVGRYDVFQPSLYCPQSIGHCNAVTLKFVTLSTVYSDTLFTVHCDTET